MVIGDREIRAPVRAVLDLAPVPLLAALILTQTLVSTTGAYVIDARLPAVGVARSSLVWRRAPFLVVVLAAAATAALLRAL